MLYILECRSFPDSKVHGANMEPTWVLSAPDGLHVGPMNLAIRVLTAERVLVAGRQPFYFRYTKRLAK